MSIDYPLVALILPFGLIKDRLVWTVFFWIGYGLMKAHRRRVSSGEGRRVGFDGSGGDLGIVSMILFVRKSPGENDGWDGFSLRRVPAKLLVVSSSPAMSSRCRSWCSDRVTRVSRRSGSQHVASMCVSRRVAKGGAVRLMGWVSLNGFF